MQKDNETLKHMIMGDTYYNVVLCVISIVVFIIYCIVKKVSFSQSFVFILKNEVGLILGYVWSVISMNLMAKSIDKAVSAGDERYARSHMSLMSTIRLIIFCVILIIIINKNTLGFMAGIMFALATLGIKIGAYLVPTIEKNIKKKKEG